MSIVCQQEMSNLDEEIGRLVEDFRKYQTKFKTNLIKMKEDYWLAFPRTWSRSSATFGVPYDTRSLKGASCLIPVLNPKIIFI